MQPSTSRKLGIVVVAALATIAVGVAPAAAQNGKQPLRCPGKSVTPVRDRAIRGLPVKEARRFAARRGCDMRVVRRNGVDLVITDDFSFDRVNVSVVAGRVVDVTGIY